MEKNEKPVAIDDTQGQVEAVKEELTVDGVDTLKLDAQKEDKMKRKQQRKKKLKSFLIVALVFVIIVGLGIVWLISAGRNDGPVYGDRCASLVTLDSGIFNEVETTMEENSAINDVAISVDCRIIKINIDYVEGTSKESATALASDTLHLLDDSAGYEKTDGGQWSYLLNTHDGRSQYDADFMLTTTNNEDFPIFGAKKAELDLISWTYASIKNQATTDKVLEEAAQDAADAVDDSASTD